MRKGWTFEVESYENDGDYKSVVKYTVDTREKADAISALIGVFKDSEVGNSYEPSDDELTIMGEKFMVWAKAHQSFFEEHVADTLESFEPIDLTDAAVDIASNVGLAGRGDFFTRNPSKVKVYYCPEDVYLNDVTEEFKS
jgi:hypothetical protein